MKATIFYFTKNEIKHKLQEGAKFGFIGAERDNEEVLVEIVIGNLTDEDGEAAMGSALFYISKEGVASQLGISPKQIAFGKTSYNHWEVQFTVYIDSNAEVDDRYVVDLKEVADIDRECRRQLYNLNNKNN